MLLGTKWDYFDLWVENSIILLSTVYNLVNVTSNGIALGIPKSSSKNKGIAQLSMS